MARSSWQLRLAAVLTPGAIAVVYVALSAIWITFSDRLLDVLPAEARATAGTAKGLAFVVVTGVMLYALIRASRLTIQASEARYRLLFESNPQPMWVFDDETHRFLEVNDAAIAQYGYTREEFLAARVDDIRPAEDQVRFAKYLDRSRGESAHRSSWRHVRRDGSIIEVEIVSHALTFEGRRARLVLATDVTQYNRLQRGIIQTQKLESVGQLAGGISHDMGNLLFVIDGFASTAAGMASSDAQAEDLAEVRGAVRRARELVSQLRTVARRQPGDPRPTDLRRLVDGALPLVRQLVGNEVEIEIEEPGVSLVANVDPGQLEQVILNLAANARDAMAGTGRLTIRLQRSAVGSAGHTEHGDPYEAGDYGVLSVTDTGSGIAPDVLTHIFEPFFTTKEDKGTGLGLATGHGIVGQAGGHIVVETALGEGTTFELWLPLAVNPASPAPI